MCSYAGFGLVSYLNINFCEYLCSAQHGRDCSENALLPESVCKQIQQCDRDGPVYMLPLDGLAKRGRMKILAVVSLLNFGTLDSPGQAAGDEAMDPALQVMVMRQA